MPLNKKVLLTAIALAIMVFGTTPALLNAASTPLFHVTLIAPGNANITRRQWGAIIANSMQFVGIDANVVFLSWGAVYARVLTPAPDNIGKTYDNGGYDIQLIGWTPGAFPISGLFQIYYGKNLPPNSNYFLWQNSSFDQSMDTALANGYTPAGQAAVWNAERIQFTDLPASQILFSSVVMPANPAIDFYGYEWVFDNLGPTPDFVKYPGHTSLTLGSTGELLALNPPLSNSWYDTIAFAPLYNGLYGLDSNLNVVPALADNWTISADKYTYTYYMRSATWQDNVPVTADDVLFSFLGYLDYDTGTQQAGYVSGYLGDDVTFTWSNGTQTRLVLNNENGVSWYGPASGTPTVQSDGRVASITASSDNNVVTIKIANFGTSGKPAATFHPEGDGITIIPKHILESVPFSKWLEHPFNTGSGTYTGGDGKQWSGPIGTGPYKFVSYDSVTALVHETKYTDYWNKSAEENNGLFGIQDYYVRYIVEKDPAIAALKTGDVDVLDANYQMQKDARLGVLNFAKVYTLNNAGLQQMGYNMKHPIFGTGMATPAGISDPANAWMYARDVRTAFDLLIPRQLIIDNLLDGYGQPADVHVPPGTTTAGLDWRAPDISPRPYDPNLAKAYLAAAGYQTGVPPITSTRPSVPNFLLGFPLQVSGTFINPVTGKGYGGMVVILQQSTDNKTWTNVMTGSTDASGYYVLNYIPTQAGTFYYRVYFSGVTTSDAAFGGAAGPDYNYSALPTVLPPEAGPSFQQTITSISDLLNSYATQNSVTSLTQQVQSLQSANTQLQTTVNNLQGQLGTTTTLVYGAIVLAIVVGAAGFLFARRKQ